MLRFAAVLFASSRPSEHASCAPVDNAKGDTTKPTIVASRLNLVCPAPPDVYVCASFCFFLASVGENSGHDREEHDQHLPAGRVAGVLEWQRGQHSQDHAGERDAFLGLRDV